MREPTDDLVSLLRVVSVRDDAVDWVRMLDEGIHPAGYAEAREPSVVRVRPGAFARWFVLRPLSVGDFCAVETQPSQAAKELAAFRLACVTIENFHGVGLALRPDVPVPIPAGASVVRTARHVWGDDAIERVAETCGMLTILEIGRVAYERAAEGNGWGGSGSFTLPPFLLPDMRRIGDRLAEHLRMRAQTTSSERSASGSTTRPAPSSDAPTSAPAESGPPPADAKGRTSSKQTPASKRSSPSRKRRVSVS